MITESGRARGGTEKIEAGGFAGAPSDASGRVIAWLAHCAADDARVNALLGTVINAPKVAAELG